MPPKKRSNSEAGPSGQSGPARGKKSSKQSTEIEEEDNDSWEDEDSNDELENRPPYEYYCINRPFFDVENENNEKEDDDQLDEDELIDKFNENARSKDNIATNPAAEHPEYKWISMWETWKLYADLKRRATYTNPDNFGMYIYNDFHGYGLQELVESTLIAFNKEFEKKNREENTLKQMWAIIAGTTHWLLDEELGPWMMMDDGERLETTVELIGQALVTVLNELDQAQMLKADSDIKDLGLVIACYLQWIETLNDLGCESDFRKEAIGYAKKAGIDLKDAGCYGMEQVLGEFGNTKPLAGNAKADRWNWKKSFKKFAKDNEIGGKEKYNILKMSRRERASHAFDKKDPLAGIPEKDLKEGNIMLA
ncbi:hypothetical protein F5B20DRAFT_582593 [Whalleya microplaca]|nr:hypothetical protein F5B20DRAFT_582593 [Whalleya microplaca]